MPGLMPGAYYLGIKSTPAPEPLKALQPAEPLVRLM